MKIGTDWSLLLAAGIIASTIATTPAREIRTCVAALHTLSEGRHIDSEVVNASFELKCRRVQ